MTIRFDGSKASAAYSAAFRRMAMLPGFDVAATLRAEAGVILKQWAGKTKVATKQTIARNARFIALKRLGATKGGAAGDVTINAGARGLEGLVWYQTKTSKGGGGKFQLAGRMDSTGRFVSNWLHFKDAAWRDINESVMDAEIAIRRENERGQRAAGLARQSVIQIADTLGIDLNSVSGRGVSSAGIAKARAAIASNGRAYRNGTGSQGEDGGKGKYYVHLLNTLPYNSKSGMDVELARILGGRAKFIQMSYAKGAFNSIAASQRAFPNVFKQTAVAA